MALSLAEARAAVAAAAAPLAAETVPLDEALDRVLAEDVVASGDVPPFANAAMDGFAVRAGPAGRRVQVVGESRAGAPAHVAVGEGEAVRISTGAVVPAGADGVLQVERVREDAAAVVLEDAVAAGTNVRAAGDDVRAGARVLDAGTALGPVELGVAVTAGRAVLRVARRPRVAVLVTGDELAPPGGTLGPGQVHESNGPVLAALARRGGADVVRRSAVGDDRGATERALAAALAGADLVLVSGGVSVGPHDHVKPALAALGVDERFWRVALRPGGPLWFGARGSALVFGLPGNPVSAAVCFRLFALPALRALQGAPFAAPAARAALTAPVPRHPVRDEAVRVRLATDAGAVLRATATGAQGSHRLSSLLGADGLALVPAGAGELAAGTVVEVELLT